MSNLNANTISQKMLSSLNTGKSTTTVTNADRGLFATELLQNLIGKDSNENSTETYVPSTEKIPPTSSEIEAFLNSSKGRYTTTINWDDYKKVLSPEQIESLSREFGGELTLMQYAEAMKVIDRLATAETEEEETIDEMADEVAKVEEVPENYGAYGEVFVNSLNFFEINADTVFKDYEEITFENININNKNYDSEMYVSLLGGDEDTDPAIIKALQAAMDETNATPLGLGDDGSITHLSPLLIQSMNAKYTGKSSALFGNNLSMSISSLESIIENYQNHVDASVKSSEHYEEDLAFMQSFLSHLESANNGNSTEYETLAHEMYAHNNLIKLSNF